MKSLKKSLNILLSTAAALILLVACSINSSIKKPETTVSIAAFPENVQSVWINGEENAATYTAGVNEGVVENVEILKEQLRVKIKDGDGFLYKKCKASDVKIIKNVASNKLTDEDKEHLKELRELEKLEKMDNENNNSDI